MPVPEKTKPTAEDNARFLRILESVEGPERAHQKAVADHISALETENAELKAKVESSDHLLTPAEVAKQWKTSARHILRLCRSGRLPFIKISERTFRIHPADVRRVMAEQRIASEGGEQ